MPRYPRSQSPTNEAALPPPGPATRPKRVQANKIRKAIEDEAAAGPIPNQPTTPSAENPSNAAATVPGVPPKKQLTAQQQQALRDIKQQKLQVLEQMVEYRRTHVLETAKPSPKQQLAFDALLNPAFRTIAIFGGNRFGKTWWAAAAAVAITQGRFPWVPKPEVAPTQSLRIVDGQILEKVGGLDTLDPGALRFKRPVRIRMFGEDMTSLEKVLVPQLTEFIAPEWLVSTKKNSFGVTTHWIFKDGSVIDLLTYNQDPAMMEGWYGDAVFYDEPPPRAVYVANSRGLIDRNGISCFSMTPLKEPWIADEILNNPDPSIWCLTVDTRDNPHLNEAAIKEFEDKLTDEEKETRVHGKFLHLQGLVFPEFDKLTHVIPSFEPDPGDTVFVSIDTHPRTEQALVFVSVDKRGNIFQCHESFSHGTPEAVADRIIDFHKTVHKVEQAIIEPGSKGDKNRGESTYEIIHRRLSAQGIPLDLGSKDLSGGILQMKDALRSRNGLASLFISERCTRTLWELARYTWKDWKNAGSSDKGEMNKPVDKDDHMIECLRRLVQLPVRWVSPTCRSDFLKQHWQPQDELAGY